jgi:hypothetical protein
MAIPDAHVHRAALGTDAAPAHGWAQYAPLLENFGKFYPAATQ